MSESFARLRPRCNASGQDIPSYGGSYKIEGTDRYRCPDCGKPVKLRAKYPATLLRGARGFVVIPHHHRAIQP